jgi:hypothetical protein
LTWGRRASEAERACGDPAHGLPAEPSHTILEPRASARDLQLALARGVGLVLTPFALYALRVPPEKVGRWLA